MIELPKHIAESKFLTSEQLSLLASVDELPAVDPSFDDEKLKNIFQYYSLTPDEMDEEVQRHASALLSECKVFDAWQVLLSL